MSYPSLYTIVYVWQAEHIALDKPQSQCQAQSYWSAWNNEDECGAPTRGGGMCLQAAPPPNHILKLKKNSFVEMMLSNVLCDLLFSQTQPLKLADD